MSDELEFDWSQPATKGDAAMIRKDMDIVRKDMELLESRLRRRTDLQTVLVVLALLGSPLVSSLAQRYVPVLP